jgi:hypothetical protein
MKAKTFYIILAAIAFIGIIVAVFTHSLVAAGVTFAITPLAGYVRVCQAKSGGIRKLYLTEKANVLGFTLTGEIYDAVTMNGTAVFYLYEFEQDTAEYKVATAFENGSKKVTHDIEVKLDYLLTASRTEIEAIADASHCGLVAIIEDMNGQAWVVGYSEAMLLDRPLRLLTAEGTTGKGLTDSNGDILKFQSIDTQRARAFTGTVPVTAVPAP